MDYQVPLEHWLSWNQAVGRTGTSMIETLHDTSAMKTSNLTNTWFIKQIKLAN